MFNSDQIVIGIENELSGITINNAKQILFDSELPNDLANAILDCSIPATSANQKCEIVSKKIVNNIDLNNFLQYIDMLKQAGAYAPDHKAGLHIHLSIDNWTRRDAYRIIKAFAFVENILLSAMPLNPERSKYTQLMPKAYREQANSDNFDIIMYKILNVNNHMRHYCKARYYCINVHSYRELCGIEIRLFNATTNIAEIKAYAEFCCALAKYALKRDFSLKNTMKISRRNMSDLLCRIGLVGPEYAATRKILLGKLV